MKFSTHNNVFVSFVAALLAASAPSLVAAKGGGGGNPDQDVCAIQNCPSGKGPLTPTTCMFCNSKADCADFCPPDDDDCGCVAWSITYCGYRWNEDRGVGCNEYSNHVPEIATNTVPPSYRVQGKSSDSGKKYCWEVRDGKIELGNKIVLGRCNDNNNDQRFDVNVFRSATGESVASLSPAGYPALVVVGVRDIDEKSWLRIERATLAFDTSQIFNVRDDGRVGIGGDRDCDEDEDEDCLFVTNQGTHANKGKPVMLSTMERLDRFVKHGDVIREWMLV